MVGLFDEFTPSDWPEWLEIKADLSDSRSYWLTKFEGSLYLIYRRESGEPQLAHAKPQYGPPYLLLGLGWTTIAEWPAETSRQALMANFPTTLMEAML